MTFRRMTVNSPIHPSPPKVQNVPPCQAEDIGRTCRKRRRRSESMITVSTPVQAMLLGLFLWDSVSMIWLDAFVIRSPHLHFNGLSRTCRSQHQNWYRRTRLWDSEFSSDGKDTTTLSQKDLVHVANGVSYSPNGVASTANGSINGHHHQTQSASVPPQIDSPDKMDIPRPTANGGFTHTNASRAKISAANKGKTPWNKGKNRSEEVRARIAAGVRARNRERLLKKLEEMGLTEEEYEEQKKEEKRKREAERRARKTANGGYTPTEETKAKISKALKEKHASGQVKKRQLDPSKVRRGFTHSEETRRKISASLKKRWNNDDEYREHMKESYSKANSREETRRKISESLKRRWSDPEFREDMTKKMAESRNGREAINYDSSYRKKISEAMKKKWQDPAYREKTLTSIQQAAQNRTGETSPHRTKKKKSVTKSVDMQLITPLSATDLVRRKKKVVAKKKRSVRNVAVTPMEPRKASSSRSKLKGATRMSHHEQLGDDQLADLPKKNAKAKRKRKSSNEKDGSVSRLREERRDLFDLLYGDDDSLLVDDINQEDMGGISEESTLSKLGIVFGDEDLDAFDPYGLDDY